MNPFICALLAGASALALGLPTPTEAHDIYTGVRGKNGQLCCGGDDCASTSYREQGGRFEFFTRERRWVAIPEERITFLPVPGDTVDVSNDSSHRAHLCYRKATDYDLVSPAHSSVFGDIFLYCAFIPPGAI